MPIAVRTYETDATGVVPPAAYLRWFQELAVHGSADRGFDADRYAELGATWVIREFVLSVLTQLGAGEETVGVTWVSEIQRANSHREYALRRPGGEVVAAGQARWVFVDRDTGRPRRISDEMLNAFAPSGTIAVSDVEWGSDIMRIPEDAPVQRAEHEVAWSEIDGARHVNNAVYARWAVDFIRATSGSVRPVSKMRLMFRSPIVCGQPVEWSLYSGDERHYVLQVSVGEDGRAAATVVTELSK